MSFPSPGDLSDPGIKPTSPVDVADRFFNLSHLGSLLAAAGAKSLPSIMASLAAQLVKNLPGMRETWVRSKGWEDPLEKGNATHSSILAWRITVHGVAKSQTQLSDFHSLHNGL